jgi:hypothetical protein
LQMQSFTRSGNENQASALPFGSYMCSPQYTQEQQQRQQTSMPVGSGYWCLPPAPAAPLDTYNISREGGAPLIPPTPQPPPRSQDSGSHQRADGLRGFGAAGAAAGGGGGGMQWGSPTS